MKRIAWVFAENITGFERRAESEGSDDRNKPTVSVVTQSLVGMLYGFVRAANPAQNKNNRTIPVTIVNTKTRPAHGPLG